jgi:recombination associated protein RdgC
MFFRNLTLFRFPVSLKKSFDKLDDALADCRLKPVGPLEAGSRGFVSPFGREDAALSHRIGEAIWLSVGGEDRLLPASVVNDALAKKVAQLEAKQGRKLGGRARRRLKDDLVQELLPKAFVRPVRTDAMLDLGHGLLLVDSASRKAAEAVSSGLRHALGSFPALPLQSEVAPRSVLTGWLAGGKLPKGLALGDECELRDPADGGAVVKFQRHELQGEEIAKHLEAGKQCARLALRFEEQVGFVLGDDLVLRKLKFLDGAVDGIENSEPDSIEAELDARFALMSAELHRLFALLEKALKLSRAEA